MAAPFYILRSEGRGVGGNVGQGCATNDEVSGDAFRFGFEIQDEAMAQGGRGDGLNVLETDVVAALNEGADFAGEQKSLGAARTAAEAQILIGDGGGGLSFGMGGENEADGVILDVRGDGNLTDEALEFDDLLFCQYSGDLGFRAFGGAGEDFAEFSAAGIADDQFEKETVELRFRQRISAFLVNRILGGHDKERLLEFANLAAGGDAFLLHGFEHGGLRFGGGAIDFVGENQVGKNGAVLELEFAFAAGGFHDDVGAEDVGRHEIGSELNAVEAHVESFAESADEECFAEAGDAFEEDVTSAENGDEGAFDDGVVPDDHLADFIAQRRVGVAELLDLGFDCHGELGWCRVKGKETRESARIYQYYLWAVVCCRSHNRSV